MALDRLTTGRIDFIEKVLRKHELETLDSLWKGARDGEEAQGG